MRLIGNLEWSFWDFVVVVVIVCNILVIHESSGESVCKVVSY